MKVICFRGKGKTRKTTILTRVLNEYFNIKIHEGKKDFIITFPYKDYLVGICSAGDSLGHVKKGIKIFESQRCRKVICSCRSRGKGLKYLKDKFGTDVSFIEKEGEYFGESEYQEFIRKFNSV